MFNAQRIPGFDDLLDHPVGVHRNRGDGNLTDPESSEEEEEK